MTATIQKWGKSLAVRIPRAVAHQINFEDGDEVELKVNADSLVVRAARRRYRLADLVRGITPKNRHDEVDWSKPVGKEFR